MWTAFEQDATALRVALRVLLCLPALLGGFSPPGTGSHERATVWHHAREEGWQAPDWQRPRTDGALARGDALHPSACPPLPPSAGPIVDVSSVAELQAAVAHAVTGTTIRLADGHYDLDGIYLRFGVPGITLRSLGEDREAVILDGNYQTTEIIQIAASDITIADLTVQEARYHPIHIMSTEVSHTLNALVYNVRIVDPGQQAIKINPGGEGGFYPDGGEIACSAIELTDAGRAYVWDINGSCYTGGIDAHQARDWVVRDSEIEGFWCGSGLAEHAIHFWRGSRDTVVERNVLVDNARGVGFGLMEEGEGRTYDDDPCDSTEGGYVGHYGGFVRNNAVFAGRSELFTSQYGFDCGICLWQACGAQVAHNTVASLEAPFSSIEWRFDQTDVDIVNNLVTHVLLDRGGSARLAGNLEGQPLSLFVDGPGANLHLRGTAAGAIDHGVALQPGLCDDDMDGAVRPFGPAPDVGADEYGVPPRSYTFLPSVVRGGWSRCAQVQKVGESD
jgi:hypothetical protein